MPEVCQVLNKTDDEREKYKKELILHFRETYTLPLIL